MALTERLQILIDADAKGAQRELQAFGRTSEREIGRADDKLRALSGQLGAFGAAALAAGGLAAAGLFKIGTTFEDVNRKIVVGTGATGQALAQLNADARAVVSTTASTVDDVGTAIADLNTRLGLSGGPLRELSGQFLDLSRLTGTQIGSNIRDITRVFGDWGIATADQSTALDKLFVASQSTGIAIDQLTQGIVQFGAPLRGLGFSFEEAVALFSKFEKEGVNVTTVLAGLRRGLSGFARDGEEPAAAFARLVDEIANAGTESEATALSFRAFGDRAGADLARAIREGRFEIGELVEVLGGADGALATTAAEAETFQERISKAFNQLQLALEPVAAPTFEGVGKATEGIGSLVSQLDRVPPAVSGVAGGIAGLAIAGAVGAGGLALVAAAGLRTVDTLRTVKTRVGDTRPFTALSNASRDAAGNLTALGRAGRALSFAGGAVGAALLANSLFDLTRNTENATNRLNQLKTLSEDASLGQGLAQLAAYGREMRSLWDNIGRAPFDQLVLDDEGFATSLLDIRSALQNLNESQQFDQLEQSLESLRAAIEVPANVEKGVSGDLEQLVSRYEQILSTARGARDVDAKSAEASADATESDAEAKERASTAADKLKNALGRLSAQQRLNSLEFDIGTARADSFAAALERSTRADNILQSAVGAGKALLGLRDALGLIPEEAGKARRANEDAAQSVDLLTDAVQRTDPALSRLGISLGAGRAAASAFGQALQDASGFGQRLGSALGVGDAFRDFRSTFRRLPEDLDLAAISLGKLRPRTAEAVRNLLQLGSATGDYLRSLLETGASSAEVRAEANRLNAAFREQFAQLGLTGEQLDEYIKLTNTTPEQIDTAIRLAGIEGARFKLNAYLGLLQGKIPPEVATDVIASIDADDLDGAAAKLKRFADTNPVRIDVTPQGTVELERAEESLGKAKGTIEDLPRTYQPLLAATGKYSELQLDALDAVLGLGGAWRDFLSEVVGSDPQKAIEYAGELRDAFDETVAGLGLNKDELNSYYELLGIHPRQIETAIELSNFDATVFEITTVIALLEGIGELDPEVTLQLADDLLKGDYAAVKELLTETVDKKVRPVVEEPAVPSGGSPFLQALLGNSTAEFQVPYRLGFGADTTDAERDVAGFRGNESRQQTDLPFGANTAPGERDVRAFGQDVGSGNFGTPRAPIGGNTNPAVEAYNRFRSQIEASPVLIPMVTRIIGDGGYGTPFRQDIIDAAGGGGSKWVNRASGGAVFGPGSGTSDSIPAWLSNGEFVIKEKSAKQIGYDSLAFMNATGELPGFASGGVVGADPAAFGDTLGRTAARYIEAAFDRSLERALTAQRGINPPQQDRPDGVTDFVWNLKAFRDQFIAAGLGGTTGGGPLVRYAHTDSLGGSREFAPPRQGAMSDDATRVLREIADTLRDSPSGVVIEGDVVAHVQQPDETPTEMLRALRNAAWLGV